ncbi:MAG TPA: hypothetical protein DDX04_03435 [Massilia sp.]|nr:hypothetical protein [Massilia sp.]
MRLAGAWRAVQDLVQGMRGNRIGQFSFLFLFHFRGRIVGACAPSSAVGALVVQRVVVAIERAEGELAKALKRLGHAPSQRYGSRPRPSFVPVRCQQRADFFRRMAPGPQQIAAGKIVELAILEDPDWAEAAMLHD